MREPHKLVKHTQIICRLLPTNCLSVFDQFVGFTLKGLKKVSNATNKTIHISPLNTLSIKTGPIECYKIFL